ncbi:MAG: ribbon-helix-helix protein, CopG family [Acidobacteriota bacterium]|nr:ribbon-helix-helix protein, CopG family [Acidobacteriota bacterium]
MTKTNSYRTKSGRVLTDRDIEKMSVEVESKNVDVEALKSRKRGRPFKGAGPADVVPVRLDAKLRKAVAVRAAKEHVTSSDVIRRALQEFLHVV